MPLWQGNNPIPFSPGNIKSIVAWYDNSSVDTITPDSTDWLGSGVITYSIGEVVQYLGIYYISRYVVFDNLNPSIPIPGFNSITPYEPYSIVYYSGYGTYRSTRYVLGSLDPPGINTSGDWEFLFPDNNIRNVWELYVPILTRWIDKSSFKNNLSSNFTYDIPGQGSSPFLTDNSIYTRNTILTNTKLLESRTPLTGATVFCVASIDLGAQALNINNSNDRVITNLVSVFANNIGPNIYANNITIGCHIYSNSGDPNRSVGGLIYANTSYTYEMIQLAPSASNIYNNLITNVPQLFTGINIGYTEANLYLNGKEIESDSRAPLITTDINNFNIFIGDSSNYTASISGDIGGGVTVRHASASSFKEIIVYNSKLSESDISDIHRYLQAKHNLPTLFNDGNFTY